MTVGKERGRQICDVRVIWKRKMNLGTGCDVREG
jgi:hypothetical protein